jgi:flagellin
LAQRKSGEAIPGFKDLSPSPINRIGFSCTAKGAEAVSFGVLNNLSAMYAESSLNNAYAGLSTALEQLSTGSRVNSASDDPAALSMIDGMQATITGLKQSAIDQTISDGRYQVADGALSQVNTLLERALTLATEASNGTLNASQDNSANVEYQSLLDEIKNIATTTTYNQSSVFAGGIAGLGAQASAFSIGSTSGASADYLSTAGLSSTGANIADPDTQAPTLSSNSSVTLDSPVAAGSTPAGASSQDVPSGNLSNTDLLTPDDARNSVKALNAAIAQVSAQDGGAGTSINAGASQFQFINAEIAALTGALNAIQQADMAKVTSDMAKYEILIQTSLSSLSQADKVQKEVLQTLPQ